MGLTLTRTPLQHTPEEWRRLSRILSTAIWHFDIHDHYVFFQSWDTFSSMVGEPSIAILTVRDSDLLLTSFVQVIVKEEQRCTKDVVIYWQSSGWRQREMVFATYFTFVMWCKQDIQLNVGQDFILSNKSWLDCGKWSLYDRRAWLFYFS